MKGIVLSSWDHIMGPQIERLWIIKNIVLGEVNSIPVDILREFNITKFNKTPSTVIDQYPEITSYSAMCGQLLLGEVDSFQSYDKWPSRLYVSDTNVIIAVLCHTKSWVCCANPSRNNKDICLCFGIIFQRETLKCVFSCYSSIDTLLRKAINVIQNSKVSHAFVMKELTAIVQDIMKQFHSFDTSREFNDQDPDLSLLNGAVHPEFYSKSLVSHLQTSQHSLVAGRSLDTVIKVIRGLTLFSSSKEVLSFLKKSDPVLQIHINGFRIEGILKLKNARTDLDSLFQKGLSESGSLTVIDVDSGKVWQVGTLNSHFNRNLPSEVVETGVLIPQLLKEIEFIGRSDGDFHKHAERFYRHLLIQASSLIKVFDSICLSQTRLDMKEIMTMFSLQNTVDFQILLGCAEKLKPGVKNNFMCQILFP